VFKEALGDCAKQVSAAECVTVNCATKYGNGIFSPYGTGKTYFAACTTKIVNDVEITNINVYKCPKNTEFDRTPSVSTCVYKCPRIGNYPYILDSVADTKRYYECKTIGGKLTGTLSQCTDGDVFMNGNCRTVY
jgi:hypothetical protein